MNKYFKKIVILFYSTVFLTIPLFAFAASQSLENLNQVGQEGENAPWVGASGNASLAGIVGVAINAFLGLLGVMFIIYMLYAGYNWMIAQGDEEKVTKAKDTITRAIIGLIITISAWAIGTFVFGKLIAGGILK